MRRVDGDQFLSLAGFGESRKNNYTLTEKDCLAVVYAIQKWRNYLHRESFAMLTDHLSPKWFMNLRDP